MEDFKRMVKMKTGGSVSKAVEEKMCSGGMSKGGKYKEGGKVHDDAAQDKALIKKELGKFAKKEDKEEKTELKLKSGGRAKKATGTVSKYKAGGVAKAPSEATKRPALKGSDVEKQKSLPAGEKDAIKKVKPTGDKKASAPSKGAVKSKDVKKLADGGSVNAINNIDPKIVKNLKPKTMPNPVTDPKFAEWLMTGKGPRPQSPDTSQPLKKGGKAKKMANGGTTGAGGIGSQSPIPPSIAAQLMMAAKGAQLQGANPSVMGSNPLPVDNPVVGGGVQGTPIVGGQMPQQGSPGSAQPFNAYQNFRKQNPNARPGMTPQDIQKIMQSRALQQSNRNFTDR